MSKFAGLLVTERENYRNLIFDFSQLKNLDTYYRDYRIPAEEEFLVYADSGKFLSFKLEGNGTIITDEAIYIHPSRDDWSRENRLPLSDICKYMIFQENDRDNVRMLSRRGEKRIFGRTVTPNDTTGRELVKLLQNLQRQLVSMHPADKRDFEKTLGWMLSQIRANFRENGILNERYKNLLEQIAAFPFYITEVAYIRAENFYRLGDLERYYQFVNSLKLKVSDDIITMLGNPDNLFYSRFVEDISNPSAFYMTKSLIEPYLNLKKRPRLTLNQCLILCFLCIRLKDNDYYHAILSMIGPDIKAEDFWALCGFESKFLNESFSVIYEKLLSGTELTDQDLGKRDALCLTPLHYALIMKQNEPVKKLLHSADWYDYKCPYPSEDTISTVYRFSFLAASLYDDYSLIREVVLYTNSNAKALLRAQKQLRLFLEINEGLLYKVLDESERIDIEQRIEGYRAMLSEVHTEIESLVAHEIHASRTMAERIIKEKDPFTKYIMHLYLAPDALYRLIADTISSWRIYRYKRTFFVSSVEHDLELSYYEWRDGRIFSHDIKETDIGEAGAAFKRSDQMDGDLYINPEITRFEKQRRQEAEAKRRAERRKRRQRERATDTAASTRMASSYFSEEAHRDIKALKKEYRKLVKKYHPDSGEEASAEILLVIMNERADILERMG